MGIKMGIKMGIMVAAKDCLFKATEPLEDLWASGYRSTAARERGQR